VAELMMQIDAVPRRVVIVGTTGAGKSTLAKRVAKISAAQYIELDALYWEPNWTAAPEPTFIARVRLATECGAWVVEGNYGSVREMLWHRADLVIWLDYSIARVYGQLVRRQLSRVLRRTPLWQGNIQSARSAFFSRAAVSFWSVGLRRIHHAHRSEYARHSAAALHELRILRARSPHEVEALLARLAVLQRRTQSSGI
jgi:adenylate kinase family enzyme